jgi:hypothetical protein
LGRFDPGFWADIQKQRVAYFREFFEKQGAPSDPDRQLPLSKPFLKQASRPAARLDFD